MAKPLPSQDVLLQLLRYEPETGKLFWKQRPRAFFHIDHIDGDGGNNRIGNMREAPQSINMRNAKRSSRNTTGCTGVYWREDRKKWVAAIRVDGRLTTLGYFALKNEAIAIRKSAESANSFHPNHDRVVV